MGRAGFNIFSATALADLEEYIVEQSVLDKLPSALKSIDDPATNEVEHTYAILDQASGQTTYLNNLGKILGYSNRILTHGMRPMAQAMMRQQPPSGQQC